MARWIAFDQKTSSLLRSRLAQGTAVETFGRGAVDYALAKPGAVVTLLPAAGGLDVGIAVFRRPKLVARVASVPVGRVAPPPAPVLPAKAAPSPKKAASSSKTLAPKVQKAPTTRAGGFLGLSDELFDEEPANEQKKGWWRKLWEEEE